MRTIIFMLTLFVSSALPAQTTSTQIFERSWSKTPWVLEGSWEVPTSRMWDYLDYQPFSTQYDKISLNLDLKVSGIMPGSDFTYGLSFFTNGINDPVRYQFFHSEYFSNVSSYFVVRKSWDFDNFEELQSWLNSTNDNAKFYIETNSFNSAHTAEIRAQLDYSTVPEPSTYILMASGLMGLGLVSRRRNTKKM